MTKGRQRKRRVPEWALLVLRAWREMRLLAATGQLPEGKPYSAQPAWKMELWEAYWEGRG